MNTCLYIYIYTHTHTHKRTRMHACLGVNMFLPLARTPGSNLTRTSQSASPSVWTKFEFYASIPNRPVCNKPERSIICIIIRTSVLRVHVYIHSTYIHSIYIHDYIYSPTCPFGWADAYVFIFEHMCMYIYMYIYIHTRTSIVNIYMHLHISCAYTCMNLHTREPRVLHMHNNKDKKSCACHLLLLQ
jgi:hypothetical protein